MAATDAGASAGTPAAAASTSGGASAFNPSISVILTGTYANLSQDPADLVDRRLPARRRRDRAGRAQLQPRRIGDHLRGERRSVFLREPDRRAVGRGRPRRRGSVLPYDVVAGRASRSRAVASSQASATSTRCTRTPGISSTSRSPTRRSSAASSAQDGVQVKWLAPTDLFLEFGAEVGNGGAFPGTREDGNGLNAVALFAHVGGDLGDSIGWRAGCFLDRRRCARTAPTRTSNALGDPVTNAFTGQSRTWIVDATLKWAPGGDARRKALEAAGGIHAARGRRQPRVRPRRRGARRPLSQQAGRLVRAGRRTSSRRAGAPACATTRSIRATRASASSTTATLTGGDFPLLAPAIADRASR